MVHEKFEIEVLERLNSRKLLDPLVFGGGTMLRLCYDLNRYSADLDFWFVKKTDVPKFHNKMKTFLNSVYTVSDAHSKRFSLVYEFRSSDYPRQLKIEIRKGVKECKWKEVIAFSRGSHVQVSVKAMTLEQMMRNKIEAFLGRGEIRDCFDIEFILRKGVPIKASRKELEEMRDGIGQFKARDYSVILGSLLEKETREFYKKNRFEYLDRAITTLLSG
jgi:predicted nucleotidyltransferase component of viral defense system